MKTINGIKKFDEKGILIISENEICCYSCIHYDDDWCHAEEENRLIEIKNFVRKYCSHYKSICDFD